MRLSVKILVGFALVVLAFGLARRLGWLSGNRPASPAVVQETPVSTPDTPPAIHPPVQAVPATDAAPAFADNPALVPTTPIPPPPMERIRWEQAIDDVLTAESDSAQKAQKLLDLYPTLPESGQVEAAQHLANLIPDTNFTAAAHILTNVLTSPDVIDVLVGDLLNRPDKLKLPLMLAVARTPGHPWRAEAKQMLEIYVEKDWGDDWAAWSEAVQTWLKDHAE
jgi:hypothetical protein